ncbi:guanine nucleotide-binding protein G(I)/G(S)/G(O) subunit gamma-4 isoform X1 [Cuculus canorus]|uniref:guanine nucleotide-binding protein G(I)/G(S)/G(O) subunit gamma-4 isoform X1 n=1 Tax=Cuculus canorus TaxID=55661 RepID=UPI0023AAEC66|nr:guanine nucleotide-binding protein G(I)/G(S)/G(O) subunit gamma-4 isoform X1 [Cuculus canorus]
MCRAPGQVGRSLRSRFPISLPPSRLPAARARKNKMKELVSNSTANISQARKAVEQLKMEAYMDRMKMEHTQINETRNSWRISSAKTHVALPCFSLLSSAASVLKKPQSPAKGNN